MGIIKVIFKYILIFSQNPFRNIPESPRFIKEIIIKIFKNLPKHIQLNFI